MSYCRLSTDDFKCDIYCYSDVNGGWTTMVANNRTKEDAPPRPEANGVGIILTKEESLTFWNANATWSEANLVPIGLPYDGQTFNDPTLAAFRDRLTMLRGTGYRFPDYVFDRIDEEIEENVDTDN